MLWKWLRVNGKCMRHYLLRFKGQPKRTQHCWTISWLPSGIVLNNCGKAIGLVPTPMQVYLSKSYILHPLFNTTQKTAEQARKKKPFSSNLSWSIFELYHGFRAGGGGKGWQRGGPGLPNIWINESKCEKRTDNWSLRLLFSVVS